MAYIVRILLLCLMAYASDAQNCFVASIGVKSTYFKAGDTLHFSVNTDGAVPPISYRWEGYGYADTAARPLFIIPLGIAEKTYTVTCTVTDANCSVLVPGSFFLNDSVPNAIITNTVTPH